MDSIKAFTAAQCNLVWHINNLLCYVSWSIHSIHDSEFTKTVVDCLKSRPCENSLADFCTLAVLKAWSFSFFRVKDVGFLSL